MLCCLSALLPAHVSCAVFVLVCCVHTNLDLVRRALSRQREDNRITTLHCLLLYLMCVDFKDFHILCLVRYVVDFQVCISSRVHKTNVH